MKQLSLILTVVLFCIFWPLSWLFTLLTWLFAPILALPYFVVVDEDEREWLVKRLRWFQSFDNPLDEWWMAKPNNYCDNGKCTWLAWDFTKASHRYLGRLFWLYRNPAMGFAQGLLGMEPKGVKTVWDKGEWDSGSNNYELTLWDNCFQLKAQWFFYKNHYLRVNIGWKSHRGFSKLMLASFISPFRSWSI